MTTKMETQNMALFCDFENIALGVRDAKYSQFDIGRVLERLLLKGAIIIKKAYCDWNRYREFTSDMHEASFEMIEVPHVRQSGKNSADIRLVVDALDFCFTKPRVDTFVILSGDSDFSPLVSKLRENGKRVIGVGVKNSTSDLLIANCDEFIYYDDLVREDEAKRRRRRKPAAVAGSKPAVPQTPETAEPRSGGKSEDKSEDISEDERKQEALDLVHETLEALLEERDEDEGVWGSMIKQALRRRMPGFNERYFGFRTFTALLDEAAKRKLILLDRHETSGDSKVRLGEA